MEEKLLVRREGEKEFINLEGLQDCDKELLKLSYIGLNVSSSCDLVEPKYTFSTLEGEEAWEILLEMSDNYECAEFIHDLGNGKGYLLSAIPYFYLPSKGKNSPSFTVELIASVDVEEIEIKDYIS